MEDKPRQRGRPPGDQNLRWLRAMTWYLAVRSREGRSDYQLDGMFGTDKDGAVCQGAARIRIFEAIRRNGSIPSNGRNGRRNYDLIARVDAQQGYEGTAAIIHSPFWRLLGNHQISLGQVREMVVECVRLLGLANKPGSYKDDGPPNELEDIVSKYPEMNVEEFIRYQKDGDTLYDNAMANAFIHLPPSLDFIALLGALAIEAIHANNMFLASDHVRSFGTLLKQYCEQHWLSEAGDQLYQLGITRMIEAVNMDPLKGLPDYTLMLSTFPNVNLKSPVAAFLKRHQGFLWRR